MAAAAVFISYSSRDESFALGLMDGLSSHEVWIDSAGMPAEPLSGQCPWSAAVAQFSALRRPTCSCRDGLRTLRVVDAVLEAAHTGGPVDVPTR